MSREELINIINNTIEQVSVKASNYYESDKFKETKDFYNIPKSYLNTFKKVFNIYLDSCKEYKQDKHVQENTVYNFSILLKCIEDIQYNNKAMDYVISNIIEPQRLNDTLISNIQELTSYFRKTVNKIGDIKLLENKLKEYPEYYSILIEKLKGKTVSDFIYHYTEVNYDYHESINKYYGQLTNLYVNINNSVGSRNFIEGLNIV